MASKYDGEGLAAHAHALPPLDVAVVVDVSGSMGMRFVDGDADGDDAPPETKLDVAKRCLLAIWKQLGDADSLSVTLFNHEQTLLLPATRARDIDAGEFARRVAGV